jgi:hypothetical protein
MIQKYNTYTLVLPAQYTGQATQNLDFLLANLHFLCKQFSDWRLQLPWASTAAAKTAFLNTVARLLTYCRIL